MRGLFALLVLVGCTSGKTGETGDSGGGTTTVDADGDGYPEAVDCEDGDGAINPGAVDTPDDGIDQDCDGSDATTETTWTDADGDGFPDNVDCDDTNAATYPGAAEVAGDGVDQDCDGADATTTDADGDGYPSTIDCDDGDASVNPGATETWYDGVDQDCDGNDDDQDLDGAAEGVDCDDTASDVYPGAAETVDDGVDQDCDGVDTVSLGTLAEGDLLLTEIMNKPSVVADAYGEWIEVYNNTASAVDLDGLVVTASISTGTFTVDAPLSVAPGGYAVLVRDGDATVDGGVPWDYDYRTDFSLDNDAETLVLSYGATTLDTVAYDDTNFFPDETGYSMSLDSDHTSADENDSGQYWCDGASTYGDGDYGTPGEANAACPDMEDADGDGWVAAHDCDDAKSSVYPGATEAARDSTDSDCDGADGYAQSMRSGELLIDEIMQNPDLVGDADGEWFEFYNNTSYSWNLYGLTVKDATGTDVFTVDEDVIVTTHQYVVFAVNGDATKNGGVTIVDYDYPGSTFSLSNGSDGIYLYPSSTSTTVIDSVAWDNGVAFPDPTGASMSLKTSGFDATKNNTGSYWCTSTSNIASDPLNDLGTPGAKNDAC